jgi:hypothetical protein
MEKLIRYLRLTSHRIVGAIEHENGLVKEGKAFSDPI